MADNPKKDDPSGKNLNPATSPTGPFGSDMSINLRPNTGHIDTTLFHAPLVAIGTNTNSSSLSTSVTTIDSFVSGRLDPTTFSRFTAFDDETERLRQTVRQQALALEKAEKNEEEIRKLSGTIAQLQRRYDLVFLLNRVTSKAHSQLLGSQPFRDNFLEMNEFSAFVISIDIRRSTELMLKARTSTHFANFTRTLCTDLMNTIRDQYGVLDKFTGDGVLAFFPEFFSGADAGFRALSVANRCHELFAQHYRGFRKSFTSILTEVGLGIGVDFGPVQLVQMADGLTVVGQPVVYACRLSDAPAGSTLLNQPAFEKLSEKYGSYYFATETEIPIKHEGKMLAYDLRLNGRPFELAAPDWLPTR